MSEFTVNIDNIIASKDTPDGIRNLAYFIKSNYYTTVGSCLVSFSNEFLDRIFKIKVPVNDDKDLQNLLLIGVMLSQAEGISGFDMSDVEHLVMYTHTILCAELASRHGILNVNYGVLTMDVTEPFDKKKMVEYIGDYKDMNDLL